MQTRQPIQRLTGRIRPLIGCVVLVGLAIVSITAVFPPPGGPASSASAYAGESSPAQTAKVVKQQHVIVNDDNFETLRSTIEQASPGVTTVIELNGNYEAPVSFDTNYITIPSKADIRLSVPDGGKALLQRAEGSKSNKAFFSLMNGTSSSLTITNGITYQNSFTMAYVGTGCSLTINGGSFVNNATTGNGGLIYANNGTLTINGGTFTENSTSNGNGGAIYANDTALTINGGTFSKNTANGNGNHTGGGGAIYANGGTVTINAGSFADNTSTCEKSTWSIGGGAIYAFDATVSIGEATFTGNKAATGGRLSGGGAIWIKGKLSVNGATFSNNAHNPVGGYHFGGGAIFMSGYKVDGTKDKTSILTITKAVFSCNEANNTFDLGGGQYGDGGAIFLGWNSTMILQGQRGDIAFRGNKAARLGGAIYTEEDTVTYMAKAFATSNTAGHFGGGLWLCPSGHGVASKGNDMVAIGNTASLDVDRYANGQMATNTLRGSPASGAAGDDFALMSPTKPGISNSYELSNTGWDSDEGKQVVHWYQDGTLTKYTDGLGINSLLKNGENKGLSVAENSTRYTAGSEEYSAGTISSQNTSGVKNADDAVQCSDNTEQCVQSVGVALKATMDASKIQQYQQEAAVVFTGNHADNAGGAFGSNGAVVFASPYNAAWRKVDEKDVAAQSAQNGNRSTDVNALAGSTWTLSIKRSRITSADAQGQKAYMTADGMPTPYFSADINTANCNAMPEANRNGLCWASDGNADDPTWTAVIQDNAGYDKNPADGEFSLTNLAGGTFTLTETEAPEGYYRSTKTYTFTTGETTGIPTVKVDGEDVLGKSLSDISQIGDDAKPTSIAWNKVDAQSNDKLGGSTWQLLQKNGDGYAVVDGYGSIADCTSGDCKDSLDKDATAGGFRLEGLASGEYRLKETGVPTGYDDSETVRNRTYDFVIPDPGNRTETPDVNNVTLVDGVYVVLMKDSNGQSMFSESGKTNIIGNERKTGSVAWNKVSVESKDEKLSGSQWRLEVKSGDNWIALSYNADADGAVKWLQPTGSASPTTITDCESDGCKGADKNAESGGFRLSGLEWGTYRLIETKAPSGFVLPDKNTTWYEFTIDAQHTGDAAIALRASETEGSNAKNLLTPSVSDGQGQKPNAIANVAVVVQLPLTGDLTDRAWLLGGLALCALAALISTLGRRTTGGIK